MLDISWNASMVKDHVKLADFIELELIKAVHDSGVQIEFNYANFMSLLQDEPYEVDDGDFVSGDTADEAALHFESAVGIIEQRREWLGELYPFICDANEVRFSAASAIRRRGCRMYSCWPAQITAW